MVTYFVVQSFVRTRKGGVEADLPFEVQSEAHARRVVDRLGLTKAGVVAFSRTGDPTTGDYADAVILVAIGEVPNLAEEAAAAA